MANKIIFSMLSASILISNVVNGVPFFRKDYTYLMGTDSFYKISSTRSDWWMAKKRCALEGAKLWVPEDKNEVEVIGEFWNKTRSSVNTMFVGISDLITEGSFVALDGRSIDEIYAAWAEWEPNNADGVEDCVIIRSDTLMNDEPCAKLFHYMCKKIHATVDWNFLCEVPDLSYAYDNHLGKCYKFHPRPKNWNDAHTTCNAEQSYLAIINNVKERDALVKLIAARNNNIKDKGNFTQGLIHIGFHNRDGDGWVTVKDSSLDVSGYDHWADKQPEHYDEPDYCGAINFSGDFHEIGCDKRAFFICEHDIERLSSSLDEKFID